MANNKQRNQTTLTLNQGSANTDDQDGANPDGQDNTEANNNQGNERSNTKAPNRSNENKQRPPRVRMNAGNKLAAPKREGYQRYWAITGPDHPGKLAQMQAAYWEFVLDDEGNKDERPAGKGNTHVLMEIEQKYYDEDIADQQARNIDATQKAIQALGEDEYVPMGHKKVVERELI